MSEFDAGDGNSIPSAKRQKTVLPAPMRADSTLLEVVVGSVEKDESAITSSIPSDDFRCGHRFGNFSNYYNFHSCDERLNEIPDHLLRRLAAKRQEPEFSEQRQKIVYMLDIGCNEGDLSVGLLMKLRNALPGIDCRLLGVDLDPCLISAAKAKYKDLAHVRFECMDVVSEEFDVFKKAFLEDQGVVGFDVVSCFSTTMWVHLNFGDEGLRSFLAKIAKCSTSLLIVEPQKWKSYKTAVERCRRRRMDKFPLFGSLVWRGDGIDDHIAQHIQAICPALHLYRKTACDGDIVAKDLMYWGRSMLIFVIVEMMDDTSVSIVGNAIGVFEATGEDK